MLFFGRGRLDRYVSVVCRPVCRQCWQQGLQCTSLLAYSADADNVGDSKSLAIAALQALQADKLPEAHRWKMPLSWHALLAGPVQP